MILDMCFFKFTGHFLLKKKEKSIFLRVIFQKSHNTILPNSLWRIILFLDIQQMPGEISDPAMNIRLQINTLRESTVIIVIRLGLWNVNWICFFLLC